MWMFLPEHHKAGIGVILSDSSGVLPAGLARSVAADSTIEAKTLWLFWKDVTLLFNKGTLELSLNMLVIFSVGRSFCQMRRSTCPKERRGCWINTNAPIDVS
ncbi:unnamed protein product [Prunus armeniaca]